MILLGIVLIVIGYFTLKLLFIIGCVFVVFGALLYLAGALGGPTYPYRINNRRGWW